MNDEIDLDVLERSIQRKPVAMNIVSLALDALSSRALVWVAALGGGGIWAYAVLEPAPLRLVAALGYCVSILGPIIWRDSKG